MRAWLRIFPRRRPRPGCAAKRFPTSRAFLCHSFPESFPESLLPKTEATGAMKDGTMSRNTPQHARFRVARQTWLLSCALLGAASGCAQVSPLHRGLNKTSQQSALPNTAMAALAPANAPLQPAVAAAAAHAAAIAPVSHAEPTSAVQPAGHARLQGPIERACPMPGTPGACLQLAPVVTAAAAGQEAGPVPPYWSVQEYLYDGGDREPHVEVDEDWSVSGLNSQDTVAHYETIDGELCVTASNRVPIYAPRFGAVRKVTAPILTARAVGAERVLEPTGPAIQKTRDLAGNVTLPTGPRRQTAVKLIDGLHDRTRGIGAEKITPAVDVSSLQVAFQHLDALGSVVRREDLEAIVGQFLVNARTWTNVDSIGVILEGVQAAELRDSKQVQDVHVFDSGPAKCSLRICKGASHATANPGDIINFTIRFDNLGDKPIGNVVILDSLTTRLEYIDNSQASVLSLAEPEANAKPTKFSTEENEAGSTVLRWEIDQALEPGDRRIISFSCRVR